MKVLSTISVFLLMASFGYSQNLKNIQHKSDQEKVQDLDQILKFDLINEATSRNQTTSHSALPKAAIHFDYQKSPYFKIVHRNPNNDLIWIQGFQYQDKSASVQKRAFDWLFQANKTLKLTGEGNTYEPHSITEDEKGESHIKFRQHYNGIPIYGAEVILHTQNAEIHLLNGKIVSSAKIDQKSRARIHSSDAEALVESNLARYKENALDFGGMIESHIKQWESQIVYYKQSELYKLAYHIKVYANQAERYEYFVDAETGEILDKFSSICKMAFHENHTCRHHELIDKTNSEKSSHVPVTNQVMDGPAVANAFDLSGSSRSINTYELGNAFFLIDAVREMYNSSQSALPDEPIGAIWTIDLNNTSPVNENSLYTHVTSLDNSWNNSPEGVSAHFNAGQAYDYFRNTFNRNSITGTGQNIISFVNVSDPDENSMGNAFWNGIGIYYGNGDAFFESLGRGLDVAGHEMSHGVIESTANLEYRNESGAMNEAFADIFGAMIDRDDWTIGEDVVKISAYPSGALRDMSDPHNGAATGDFGRGWQPRHYNERYTGQEDNGGVHINSGIINHAFYRLAVSEDKMTAEDIYYRALTTYLTRSSDFADLRVACIQSAMDLFGQPVASSVATSFDDVGITGAPVDSGPTDFQINPGADLLLVSDQDLANTYLFDLQTAQAIYNPFTSTELASKPSVTDDGSRIVYVGTDNHVHLIDIDWTTSPPQFEENIISVSADWRNAVISKDGRFIALLESFLNNTIVVVDLVTGNANVFELTNPTYSEGISTGEVQFADVMEFDATSTSIMYDAYNRVNGNTGTLEFWDIGFIEVWNPDFDTWALGNIEKLFSNLPQDINIANPTFSKNSPYIIAMDIFDGLDFEILGVNLETQDINGIIPTSGLSYPNYSKDDNFMIFDLELLGYTDLGIMQLNEDKISRVTNSDQILLPGGKWGTWFSNGERLLTNTSDLEERYDILKIRPNPVQDELILEFDTSIKESDRLILNVYTQSGQLVLSKRNELKSLNRIDVSGLPSGIYSIVMMTTDAFQTEKFVKID